MVDKDLRIHESIFVPDELPTPLKVLREVALHKVLELFVAIEIY